MSTPTETDIKIRIVREYLADPTLKHEDIAERVGCSKSTISKHYSDLISRGILSKGVWLSNSDRLGFEKHYILIDAQPNRSDAADSFGSEHDFQQILIDEIASVLSEHDRYNQLVCYDARVILGGSADIILEIYAMAQDRDLLDHFSSVFLRNHPLVTKTVTIHCRRRPNGEQFS